MDVKKIIDNIVWWIPFKRLRNYMRDYMIFKLYNQENVNLKLDNINTSKNNNDNIKYSIIIFLGKKMKNVIKIFILFIAIPLVSCSKEDDENIYTPIETSEKYIDVWYNPNLKPISGNILLNPTGSDLLVLSKDASKIINKIKYDSTHLLYTFKYHANTSLYSYMEVLAPNDVKDFFNNPAVPLSTLHILDKNLKTIKSVPYIKASTSFKLNNYPLDSHDYLVIDENHYIVFTYYPAVEKETAKKVVGILIQEMKDGDIVWQWDSINFKYIRTKLGLNTATKFVDMIMFGVHQDYLHLNSIFIDPKDNNLILSIRASSSVIKIRRNPLGPSDGEIMWILGGNNDDFGLANEDKFILQHNATLLDDNKTLLLFDNGNATRPYSRIIEYKLNEVTKTVVDKKITVVKSPKTGENYYGQIQSSVQKIDNRYFISYSGSIITNRSFIVEYDITTGQVVMEIDTFKSGIGSYRAYKTR